MAINRERARQWLKAFDFRKLFIEELGWDNLSTNLVKQIDGVDYRFHAVAEKRGVVVLVSDSIPDYAIRVKLDKLIAKDHFEHLIVFTDKSQTKQVWQWVRKEQGKPTAVRTYHYSPTHSGELLFQKLDGLVFTLDEEEILTLTSVTGRMKAFDVEKVTKKFYERFKTEHSNFLSFIKGIPDKQMESWYASVMVNRLMFLYFIQEKGFLNGDRDYLRNKLAESSNRKPDAYYRDFLCPLFFQGFARKKAERSAATNKLLGEIPYLNGGLFRKHQIEELHGKTIIISDKAFEQLFDFFKEYDWHLDERENRNGNEINPDVLGYIFEKYINQKQMGAYYTKEDITEYIAQNTIIPFLLDEARKGCAVAFAPDGSVWRLLRDHPDRYIHDAMKKGADLALPLEVEAGVADVGRRSAWNRAAPEKFALPTEIWREAIDRHQRYRAVKAKLAAGEVHHVNDLVTLNLNIRQFAQDVIQFCEGPELLRAIWKAIEKVSILDPTCGSGAFLFAALNILKPLYEACLIRMQGFIEDMEAAGTHRAMKFEDFKKTLAESERHPKQDYFILKAIIVNNLFGVDIMEEAVEICKLRLFLKLVAQVDSQDRIEPLPDIDFNIRAGNTLVGYARYEDVEKAVGSKLDFGDAMSKIQDKALTLDQAVEVFRQQQTQLDGTVTAEDKAEVRRRLSELEGELNDYLSGEYGVKKSGIKKWRESYKPFHWFCDFHSIMQSGGFDVLIGNPPYVEYSKIKNQYTLKGEYDDYLSNLYAATSYRAKQIASTASRTSLIVPASLPSTDRMEILRSQLDDNAALTHVSFSTRPQKLFEGAEQRLTIYFYSPSQTPRIHAAGYLKWYSDARDTLFDTICFTETPARGYRNRIWPKIEKPITLGILQKIMAADSQIGLVALGQDAKLFYKNTGLRYFNTVSLVAPKCRINGKDAPSSRETTISVRREWLAAVHTALMSTTYFIFYQAMTNCRDLNPSDILTFPFPTGVQKSERLRELSAAVEKDCQAKSRILTMNNKLTGKVELQSLSPAKSKAIIDEIDTVLADYYGFSDVELDYILNYDIKFRLSADAIEE